MKDENKGRFIQKAKVGLSIQLVNMLANVLTKLKFLINFLIMGNDLQIEIVLGKSEKFDSLMTASAPAPAPALAPASEAATKDND